MKEAIPLLIVGLLFGIMGYWVGHNEGTKLPCEDIVLEEIANLQRDIMDCQSTNLLMLVRIAYFEDWRASILFRPPGPEITEQDKQMLRDSIEKQRKELGKDAKIQ